MKLKLTVVKIKEHKGRKEKKEEEERRQVTRKPWESLKMGRNSDGMKTQKVQIKAERLSSVAQRKNCQVRARLTSRTDEETSVEHGVQIRLSSPEQH